MGCDGEAFQGNRNSKMRVSANWRTGLKLTQSNLRPVKRINWHNPLSRRYTTNYDYLIGTYSHVSDSADIGDCAKNQTQNLLVCIYLAEIISR